MYCCWTGSGMGECCVDQHVLVLVKFWGRNIMFLPMHRSNMRRLQLSVNKMGRTARHDAASGRFKLWTHIWVGQNRAHSLPAHAHVHTPCGLRTARPSWPRSSC